VYYITRHMQTIFYNISNFVKKGKNFDENRQKKLLNERHAEYAVV